MSFLPAPGTASFKSCVARAYLAQSGVSEIRVQYGGRRYEACPRVVLSDTHGSGGAITVTMSGNAPDATGITYWQIVQGPPYDDELNAAYSARTQWSTFGAFTATDHAAAPNSDGTFLHTGLYSANYTLANPAVGVCGTTGIVGPVTVALRQPYKFSGRARDVTPAPTPTPTPTIPTVTARQYATPGGASCKINFVGAGIDYANCFRPVNGNCSCAMLFHYAWDCVSVTALNPGSGYDPASAVRLTVCANGGVNCTGIAEKDLIVEGYGPEHPNNLNSPRFSVTGLTLNSGGTNYVVPPRLVFHSESGYGAAGEVTVRNGQIDTVTLTSSGGGYKSTPTLEIVSGGASAFAVMRPHLRGVYQCYYRYVDDTPDSMGGPVASNLSPVTEFDAGDGASQISWTCAPPSEASRDGRTLYWELWRTTGDEATTLYRVHLHKASAAQTPTGAPGALTYADDLTDEELRDPDREDYAAMPIVLPNGDINAFRFVPPPRDKSAVVLYQDRHWYGVDTSGTAPNTLLYSEVDEPESVPLSNDIVIQSATGEPDSVTALAPFAGMLLVFQSRRTFSLTHGAAPALDANVLAVAERGCVSQRTWAVYNRTMYALDRSGVYALDPTGALEDLSLPVANVFRAQVAWTAAHVDKMFLAIDSAQRVLRVFVPFLDDVASEADNNYCPTRAMCYSLDTKSWWMEQYPVQITHGLTVTLDGATSTVLAIRNPTGDACGLARPGVGYTDLCCGMLTNVLVANSGAGHSVPPVMQVTGGVGGKLTAAMDGDGAVRSVVVESPGFGYSSPTVSETSYDGQSGTYVAHASPTDGFSTCRITFRYKTGNLTYANDSVDAKAASASQRDITVTYRPVQDTSALLLRAQYNNQPYARAVTASRDRGVGFSFDAETGLASLSVSKGYPQNAGTGKALLSNRTLDDIGSADRSVALRLNGAAPSTDNVVIYDLTAYGVATPQSDGS